MGEPVDGQEFRSHWFGVPTSFFLHDREPGAPPDSIEHRRGRSGRHRGIRR